MFLRLSKAFSIWTRVELNVPFCVDNSCCNNLMLVCKICSTERSTVFVRFFSSPLFFDFQCAWWKCLLNLCDDAIGSEIKRIFVFKLHAKLLWISLTIEQLGEQIQLNRIPNSFVFAVITYFLSFSCLAVTCTPLFPFAEWMVKTFRTHFCSTSSLLL